MAEGRESPRRPFIEQQHTDGVQASADGELQLAEEGQVGTDAHFQHLEGFRRSLANYQASIADKKPKSKRVVSLYERQNEIVDGILQADKLINEGLDEEAEDDDNADRWALLISFASNFVLLFIRVAIAALSGSLSIIVTTLDAALDVISGCIIYFTALHARRVNHYKYPIGKSRMEPVGVVVFSTIMGTAGFFIIIQGIQDLVQHKATDLPYPWVVIGGAIGVVAFKGVLYLICRSSQNASVQAFAMDHLNDVVVNSVGLAGALLGNYVAFWLDPTTAIVMSLWLVYAWGRQAVENINKLVDVGATYPFLQKLTYMAWAHDGAIKQVDTVRAYTHGEAYFVECDVVLPGEMPLQQAHDIGEALQIKFEKLPEVARAFVHLDYESTHAPEHKAI